MWRTWSTGRTAAVAALTAFAATGCSSVESCYLGELPGGRGANLTMVDGFHGRAASASCAAGVEYRGRFYVEWSDDLPVTKGRLLGIAIYPPCNDTGGSCAVDGPDAAGRPTRVWAMRGVDPDRVVIARQQGFDKFAVFGRLHANPRHYFRFADCTWHLRDGLVGGR
jgi:hypothetical protein